MNGHRPTQTPAAKDSRCPWLAIISGERSGAAVSAARCGLTLLAGLYRAGLAARNLRFSLPGGVRRAAVPVVSVGNLTVGGTGKTPMVALVARLVKEMGRPAAIFSRGYGAQAGRPNEEALELARLCPDTTVIQNPDRRQAIDEWAPQNSAGIAILDDGFQHRRLARDLDIVMVDATQPFGYGHVLPRGLLREPLSALRRADMVVITRTELVEPQAIETLKRQLALKLGAGKPILVARNRPTGLRMADGLARSTDWLRGRQVAAACGIGNPAAFRRTLEQAGATVQLFEVFPDHHAYTAADLTRLFSAAQAAGAKALLTTRKDFVKWGPLLVGAPAVETAALEVALEIIEGEEKLRQTLNALGAAPNSV